MESVTQEGLWDCSDCGKTEIPGFTRECPRCNSPQNSVLTPSEDWYLPDNARVITEPDELTKSDAGPAWNCGNCETLNEGDAKVCSRCDQPLDFDDTVNRRVVYDDGAGSFDTRPDPRDEMIENSLARAERAIKTEASGPRVLEDLTLPGDALPKIGTDTKFYDDIRHNAESRFEEKRRLGTMSPAMRYAYTHKRTIAIGAAVLAVLMVIGAIMGIVRVVHYYTATTDGVVTVSELHWERTVEVEEYKTLTNSDWTHPGDARVQGSENRIRTYRTVHDGWHTENYTDYETRYKTESYTDVETRYRSETYSGTCSRTVSKGNGSFGTESYSCPQTRQVSYTVSVPKTRQVPYQVPVQKSRQVEDTHQEPVWDTWYTYQVDRWVTDRWVTTSDKTATAVDWPKVTDLHQDPAPGTQVGEERVGNKEDWRESYGVIYIDSKGGSHAEQKGYDLWTKLKKDETVPARYYERNGELASINWDAA